MCVKCPRATELCGGARPPALPGRGHGRCGGVGPPASDLEAPPASGETLGSSRQRNRDRFSSQPCTSDAATARFGRLGPAAAAFCRLLQQQRVIAIRPYAIAAAENFDAVANAHSNHDCWRAVCRLRCSVGGVWRSFGDARLSCRGLRLETGVPAHAYKRPGRAQESVGSNPPPEHDPRDQSKRRKHL